MSRLTKCFADRDEYGHNSCHGGCESCNGVLCGDALEIIKKLAHYEDLEEQGYKMVSINKIVEQLEIEKNVVKSLITPRGGKAFYEGTIRGLNKALKIVRGEVK